MGKPILAFLLLCSGALGQDVVPEKHGVFRIHSPKGQGTCFVVGEPVDGLKILATAAHITQAEDSQGNPKAGSMWGGKVFYLTSDFMEKVEGGECVAQDDKADISLIVIKMERDFTILPVADASKWITQKPNPKYFPSGKLVEMWGYTSGKWDNTKGYASFLKDDYLIADCCCNPGMSGGPVTIDGVYVGVVSGGAEWYPYTDADNKQKNTTWPARAGRGSRLQANLEMIMERYKKAPK